MNLREAWSLFSGGLSTVAPKTRAEYRGMALLALRALPAEPTAVEVAAWYRDLLRRYSVSYCNATLCVLRQMARAAADIGGDRSLLAAVARVRAARAPVHSPRCPPRDFCSLALAACRSPVERTVVGLACLCGLRCGEILGLRRDDWDAATGTLRVERQRRSPTRKNRRPHAAAVGRHAGLRADLEWCIANGGDRQSHQAKRAGLWDGGYLIPWGKGALAGLWRRLRGCLPAGYASPGWGWHVCRHWGAQALADQGATVWDILRWLGDSDPSMAQTYVDRARGAAAPVGCARADVVDERAVRADARSAGTGDATTTTLGPGVVLMWR